MWKKNNENGNDVPPTLSVAKNKPRVPISNMDGGAPSPRAGKIPQSSSASNISSDMIFAGDIRGSADITIAGRFEGTIELPNNTVTIQHPSSAKATIKAKKIIVYGTVQGNLYGIELTHVMDSGSVTGDIKSPHVVLDKGCWFNGSVEMQKKKEETRKTKESAADDDHKRPAQSGPAAQPAGPKPQFTAPSGPS